MKLSIIIPIYNEENYIDKYYKEIKDLFENITFEIIFVNNGSTDKSYKLLSNLYKGNPEKIKVISLTKKCDIKSVLLCGIKHSNGEYTAIYDFKKGAKPKVLLEMLNYLDNNIETDYTYLISKIKTNEVLKKYLYEPFYENSNYIKMFKPNVKAAILKNGNKFSESNTLLEKMGFNSKGFEENIKDFSNTIIINLKTLFFAFASIQIILGILIILISLLVSLIIGKLQIIGLMFALVLILNGFNNYFIYFLTKKETSLMSNNYIEKHVLGYDEDIL